LIRYANKYDKDKIIELLKEFAIKTKSPLTGNPLSWSKTYVESILNTIFAGHGFILIDEEQTGFLVAVKTQCFWNGEIIQLQETMLHARSDILTARLIKEYIKIAKEMLGKNEIQHAVMASYVGVDLSKFGLKQLEIKWEIK
jgi:hypothetical protein